MKKVLIYFLCFLHLSGDTNLFAALGNQVPPVINSSSGGNTGYEPWYHYIGNTVNAANGNLYLSAKDISVKARGFGIEMVRAYNSLNSSNNGPFGYGWTFNYNMYLTEEAGNIDLFEGDGSKHIFTSTGGGNYSSPPRIHSKLTEDANGFSLKYKDGTSDRFDPNGKLLNTVDKNGNRLTFSYVGGKLTSVADDSGLQITFNYNPKGRISSVVDPLNRTISYDYDNNGNLIKVIDAMGNTTPYFYYGNHYLLSTVDLVGAMLRFSYYDENNKAKEIETSLYNFSTGTYLNPLRLYSIEYYGLDVNVIDALGHTTSINLNESGNPVQITDALGGIWSTGWDINTMSITSSTDPNGHTYHYAYDAYGNQTSLTDPCSNSTQYEWENIDSGAKYISLLKSTTNALGYKTSYDYDPNGNLIETTDANGNSYYNYYNTYGYVNRGADFRGSETLYSYDTHCNMVDSNDALGNVRTYAYDAAGRLLSETDPLNHTTSYQYNANDKVVEVNDALGNKTIYTYNAVGSLISTTDPNGNVTNYRHNIIGKLDKVTDALNNETSFTFDRTGNLTEITDANGNKTATTYDALGRVISVTDALGKTESWAYDATGNVISKTDKNGNKTTYEYDALNRLILTSYPDGNNVAIQYNAVGSITQAANTGGPGETTSYSYDELNRLVSVTVNYGPFSKTISYTYDPVGNRKTMTDPNGSVTTYEYDPLNRLTSITNPSNDTTTYEYDNAGRRVKVRYPTDANTTYTYDAADRLLELKNAKSMAEVISRYSYSYDDLGNRLNLNDANVGVTSCGYDATYKLTNVTYPDGNTTYTYDGTGNRLTQTVNGVPTSYAYDADNRLLSVGTTSYSYDDNGNLISKTDVDGNTTYQYDYEKRLTKVILPDANQVTYKYSAFGNRLSKTTAAGTTYYLYDGEDILMELDAAGVQKARFTHGPGIDEPISMNRSGVVSYYHFDGLGSVTSLTNTAGNVEATYKYDVFGNLKEETGTIENSYKFTSREYDKENGLYYYRARSYDSTTGRFLQPNPIYTANPYVYARNNPSSEQCEPKEPSPEKVVLPTRRRIILPDGRTGRYYWFKENILRIELDDGTVIEIEFPPPLEYQPLDEWWENDIIDPGTSDNPFDPRNFGPSYLLIYRLPRVEIWQNGMRLYPPPTWSKEEERFPRLPFDLDKPRKYILPNPPLPPPRVTTLRGNSIGSIDNDWYAKPDVNNCDLNGDGKVDINDLDIFVDGWLLISYAAYHADLARHNNVNFDDFAVLANYYGAGP